MVDRWIDFKMMLAILSTKKTFMIAVIAKAK